MELKLKSYLFNKYNILYLGNLSSMEHSSFTVIEQLSSKTGNLMIVHNNGLGTNIKDITFHTYNRHHRLRKLDLNR